MSVESTLGALSYSANRSDWPSRGPNLVREIGELKPDEFKKFQAILRQMACGIMEAHGSMLCSFLATMPYLTSTDPEAREIILRLKERTTCTTTFAELERNFEQIKKVHDSIEVVYEAALRGEVHISQRELIESIDRILSEDGGPAGTGAAEGE